MSSGLRRRASGQGGRPTLRQVSSRCAAGREEAPDLDVGERPTSSCQSARCRPGIELEAEGRAEASLRLTSTTSSSSPPHPHHKLIVS